MGDMGAVAAGPARGRRGSGAIRFPPGAACPELALEPGAPAMRSFTAIVERCPATGLHVGYVPCLDGAHTQGETLEELHANPAEVVTLALEDEEPCFETGFAGTHTVRV